MLISNKLHSFRNFMVQNYEIDLFLQIKKALGFLICICV